MTILELVSSYSVRVAPGLLVAAVFLSLLPRRLIEMRMFAYILAFILVRDTITPLGLWWFGAGWVPWLRMNSEPALVLMVGSICFGVAIAMNAVEPDLRRLIVWFRGDKWLALAGGLGGALAVFLPFIAIYAPIPMADRGGPVDLAHWLPLAVMCLLINFYEETLFRGYLQGYLEARVSLVHAALLSGVAFALGAHIPGDDGHRHSLADWIHTLRRVDCGLRPDAVRYGCVRADPRSWAFSTGGGRLLNCRNWFTLFCHFHGKTWRILDICALYRPCAGRLYTSGAMGILTQ